MLRIKFGKTDTGIQLRSDHSNPGEGDGGGVASLQGDPVLLYFCACVVPSNPESCLPCVTGRVLEEQQL